MRQKSTGKLCRSFILMLSWPGLLLAQTPTPVKVPIVGETTHTLVRLDLQRLDIKAVESGIADMASHSGMAAQDQADLLKMINTRLDSLAALQKQLIAQQATPIYFSFSQLMSVATTFIPANDANCARVLALLFPREPLQKPADLPNLPQQAWAAVSVNAGIAWGTVDNLTPFVTSNIAAPQLTFPMTASEPAALTVVFSPTEELTALEQAIPQLPAPINLPTKELTRTISNVVATVQSPPTGSVKIVIQAQDAAGAQQLKTVMTQCAGMAGSLLAANAPGAAVDQQGIIAALTPTVQEDRLTIQIDQPTLEKLGAAPLAQWLIGARQNAMMAQSASQIRQINIAVMMYVSAHQGKSPDTLDQLMQDQHLPPRLLTNPRSQTPAADFIYRKPAAGKFEPDSVLVYENPNDLKPNDSFINVGFADGHVEVMRRDELLKRIGPPATAPVR